MSFNRHEFEKAILDMFSMPTVMTFVQITMRVDQLTEVHVKFIEFRDGAEVHHEALYSVCPDGRPDVHWHKESRP